MRLPISRDGSAKKLMDELIDRYSRYDVLTYASAIAVQLLTAVVPLFLLAFLLLGTFGLQDVWRDEIGPAFAAQASRPTYKAIDAAAEGLISSPHRLWLVAAVAILIWEVSGAVRACMGGLNRIFELEETRSTPRRFALSVGMAVPVATLVLGAMLVAARGGGAVDLGPAQAVWTLVRWLLVFGLLWAVVAVLIRLAPNGHEPRGWVSLGSTLV